MADKVLTHLIFAGAALRFGFPFGGDSVRKHDALNAWDKAVAQVSPLGLDSGGVLPENITWVLHAGSEIAWNVAGTNCDTRHLGLLFEQWDLVIEKIQDVPDDLQGLDVTALQAACPKATLAPSLLIEAADAIENRAIERDQPDGERSMRTAVATFNALTGQQISEREGWVFMAILKLARAQGGKHTRDDYVDGAAYLALACESVEQETA